jgi:hypothetical protein
VLLLLHAPCWTARRAVNAIGGWCCYDRRGRRAVNPRALAAGGLVGGCHGKHFGAVRATFMQGHGRRGGGPGHGSGGLLFGCHVVVIPAIGA